jgi:SEC-C motif domain protein
VAVAATAEALMRSRYTAWNMGNIAYIRATWHPATLPVDLTPPAGLRWLSLAIGASQELADEGWVTFTAHYRQRGERGVLSERSYFMRIDGRWLYHSACVNE